AFLPTKAELAREVWRIGTNPRTSVDERLKALRLYADVRGYIEKYQAGTVINNTNNVLSQNRVMLVKDFGTDEEWELAVEEQQRKLIESAGVERIKTDSIQ